MKLYWFRGHHKNFGDELNLHVWPRLLPEEFDDDETSIFLGIGSVLFDNHPSSATKYVFGSGFGGYTPPPNVHDGSWKVYFVRGPKTAEALKLNPNLALGDSGTLIRLFVDISDRRNETISFIPHWISLERGYWENVCEQAGITLIDPRQDVEVIINQIMRSKLVIAEAMHGAIIADALRVPWVPVLPMDKANHFKWSDWAESLEISYKPQHLSPSSLKELKFSASNGNRVFSKLVSMMDDSWVRGVGNNMLIDRAARDMERLSNTVPSLSKDSALDRSIDAMLSKIDLFKMEKGLSRD